MSYNSKYTGQEVENLLGQIGEKQDKLVSGTNIKTINGTSILGSGNITISGGGSSSGGSGAYTQVNHGTSDTTFTLTPNTFHVWDEVPSLTLTLGEETAGVANEFLFQFTSGSTATSLTLPDSIKWVNDSAPVIVEGKIYQISILSGLGAYLEFNNTILKENLVTISPNGEMAYFINLQYASASELKVTYKDSNGSKTVTIPAGTSQQSVSSPGPGTETSCSITQIVPSQDFKYLYNY